LPGTSIGTKEIQDYLLLRRNNISKTIAGSVFLKAGFSQKYPVILEKLLNKSINNAKAIFVNRGDHSLSGIDFIESIIGKTEQPIFDFNQYCLRNNINCIFCSRFNILIFKLNKSKKIISHNKVCSNNKTNIINSS
jgi:hypothetical protein